MVLEDFYKVTSHNIIDKDNHIFEIKVNKDHDIFKGHFPNNPVMPGVCMMQINKELVCEILQHEIVMTKCSNVKFTALINPQINDELKITLSISETEDGIKVKNISLFEETVALKMNTFYKEI